MTTEKTKKIRVLIVDDSAFMRTALERMLLADGTIEIAGSAANGREAVEKVCRIAPDVVTLDVEMPVMDGLQALKEIMRLSPVPVVMVSSMTHEGARVTLDALDLGAVDFIGKPGSSLSVNILSLKDELLRKIHAAVMCVPRPVRLRFTEARLTTALPTVSDPVTLIDRIVVMGASTGGPPAIQQLLTGLSAGIPVPLVIAQHMPKSFTSAFASRLNQICGIRVKEGVNGEILQRSVAYICPGDAQTRFMRRDSGRYSLAITPNSLEMERFAPSINNLFISAAEVFGHRALGIILTGMGEDGVQGLKKIRDQGGLTIAQDRVSSVLYGMPRAAQEQGAAARVLNLKDIPQEIELAVR